MSITNIISAIGNNSSIYPLLVRDCGIEIPTKVLLTYNQNKKDKDVAYLATRERLVDEYSTSAVWLGGIPLLSKINSKLFKKNGFAEGISIKLLKNGENQGIDANIKRFSGKAEKEVKKLEFLKNNKAKFNSLLKVKALSEIIVPIAAMGFVIPKVIFWWTANTKKQIQKAKQKQNLWQNNFASRLPNKSAFKDFGIIGKNNVAFKGLSGVADLSTVQKMALTDGGYAVGRIATARNKDAAVDVGFKMAGMMFLNFVFPKQLEKMLDTTTSKMAKTKLDMDIKMFADKQFVDDIKAGKFKQIKLDGEKEILDFVDNNSKNIFVKYAKKYKKISFLKNGVRNPLKYVDTDDVMKFWQNIFDFSKKARKSKNIDNFAKKAKFLKGVNVLANVGITSFLLAYALPKAQFAFRKKVLNQELEPGINQ